MALLTRSRFRWHHGVLAAALGIACVPALADEPVETEKVSLPAEFVLTERAYEEGERTVLAAIDKALRGARESNQGAGLYADMQPRVLGFRDAVMAALERNLDVRKKGIEKDIAREAIAEASAVFDPVFTVTMSVSRNRSKERIEYAEKFKSATVNGATGEGDTPNAVVDHVKLSSGPIAALVFNTPRFQGFFRSKVVANAAGKTGTERSVSVAFDLEQKFPWGQSLALNVTVKRDPTFYTNNAGSEQYETFGNYDRPWTSSITGSFATPLPWMITALPAGWKMVLLTTRWSSPLLRRMPWPSLS